MSTDGAQMNQADDVDSRIAETAGEARKGARPVLEADDQHRSARTRVTLFHQSLPGLHRLVHDEAHVGSSPRGLRADGIDVDPGFAEDRGEFRELPGTVRHVDIELDHEAPPRRAHGASTLQGFRAVARRQSAYRG